MKRIAGATGLTVLLGMLVLSAPALAAPPGPGGCQQSQSASPPPARDQLGHPLEYVLVQNCTPGRTEIQDQLSVSNASGQNQQPTNLAYAYSHACNPGCESIAVAYQVVLVNEQSTTQSPQNAAVAINDSCDGCATFAYADQYVIDVPPGTTLSKQARDQIAQIRQEVDQDVHANLSFPDLDSRLKELAQELQNAVDNGLQQEGVKAGPHQDHQNTHDQGQPPQPS